MMRAIKLVVISVLLGAPPLAAQQDTTASRFDPPARMHDYATAVIDPLSWASVGASTLLDQIGDNPESWDFSDRALSNAARFVLEVSIYHGVAAYQDRSTWYQPCTCTEVPERVGHAFAEAFVDRDRAGNPHVSVARISAPYGAAFAEALWRPDRSLGQALQAGSTSLLFTGLFNIVREFVQ